MKRFLIIINILVFVMADVKVGAVSVSAEYACVIEMDSASVIYEKNARQKHSMASTTKIMTALLAVESGTTDDVVTVSRNASLQEGSSIYLRAGDKIVMRDLLYGLMLNSGNDAAVAVAEHIAGSADEFAKLMTKRAKQIGAENTQFKNPNGLDADGHYTTAYDLALIARAAMQNEEFAEIVGTKNKKITLLNNGADIYLSNHNKMLKIYEGAIGVKTGYTRATGRCLVSAAQRGEMSFIAVTLNAPNDWTDHKNMLDYAFGVCERKEIIKKDYVLKKIPISGNREIEVCTDKSVYAVVKKGESTECEVRLHISDEIDAPLNKMEKIGFAEVMQNGEVLERVDLFSKTEIAVVCDEERKNGFYECVIKVFGAWLGGKTE